MDEEIWKDIKGFEGKFQVSNCGRVKSLNYRRTGKEKILCPFNNMHGYLQINLWKGGKYKTYKVHRLVLMTFSPVADMDKLDINHKDECKTNNNLSNLEWCTRGYNNNYGTHNARVAEKKSIPIVQLTIGGKYIRSWKSAHDAERTGGFNNGNINNCCKGRHKTHGGFRWMYLSEFLDRHNGIID